MPNTETAGERVNYAATLAVLVVLAFCFPLSERLATQTGLSEVVVISALLGLLTFLVAANSVRRGVNAHRDRLAQLQQAREQVRATPQDPEAYYVGGQHLAAMLLQLGRRREASEIIDRYARLGGARETDIVGLREALSRAESRQRRARRREPETVGRRGA